MVADEAVEKGAKRGSKELSIHLSKKINKKKKYRRDKNVVVKYKLGRMCLKNTNNNLRIIGEK